MAKTYKQKYLGYSRATITNVVLIKFSNGEEWHIPAQIVCDDRDEYYKDELEDTARDYLADQDDYDITDWLSNNMNWEDVKDYAAKVTEPKQIDYAREFANAEKCVE